MLLTLHTQLTDVKRYYRRTPATLTGSCRGLCHRESWQNS
jgi:hypothetical protein